MMTLKLKRLPFQLNNYEESLKSRINMNLSLTKLTESSEITFSMQLRTSNSEFGQ